MVCGSVGAVGIASAGDAATGWKKPGATSCVGTIPAEVSGMEVASAGVATEGR